jgi:hypothetical protein
VGRGSCLFLGTLGQAVRWLSQAEARSAVCCFACAKCSTWLLIALDAMLLSCRAFAQAVLCGYRLPNGDAVMNPGEADVPPAGAQLIFLGRGGEPSAAPKHLQVWVLEVLRQCISIALERGTGHMACAGQFDLEML